jgi:hypothetical protein
MKWGIERNDEGWRDETTEKTIGKGWKADYYLYCVEALTPSPAGGCPWPPPGSSARRRRTIARLIPDKKAKSFRIEIVQDASPVQEMEKAKEEYTWATASAAPVDREGNRFLRTCAPTPIEALRGREGLRLGKTRILCRESDDVSSGAPLLHPLGRPGNRRKALPGTDEQAD